MITVLDVETTISNKGHYADPKNFLVSYAYSNGHSSGFHYYTDPDFIPVLKRVVSEARLICGFNIKFDLHWLRNHDVVATCPVWDCQLAEFIYSGQELPYDSLNEALARYDLPIKKDIVKEYWEQGISTENIPTSILHEYNEWDVFTTKLLYDTQQNLLNDKQKALTLTCGEDLKLLMEAEHVGIKWDHDKAVEKLTTYTALASDIDKQLSNYLPTDIPPNVWNWDSGDHLSVFLYGGTIEFDVAEESEAVYLSGPKKGQAYTKRKWSTVPVMFFKRFRPLEGSEVKKTANVKDAKVRYYKVDAPTLGQLKSRRNEDKLILQLLKDRSDKIKVAEMVESIMKTAATKGWEDNYIHGQFHQNVVVTGRLSSSAPNLQNTPPEVDELLVSRYAG